MTIFLQLDRWFSDSYLALDCIDVMLLTMIFCGVGMKKYHQFHDSRQEFPEV